MLCLEATRNCRLLALASAEMRWQQEIVQAKENRTPATAQPQSRLLLMHLTALPQQRLIRNSLLGHDGNRVDFHEEIRIRQSCDKEHGDRRRVGSVTPSVPECLKARQD